MAQKKIQIMTGWGRPEYAPAAAMLLKCAFKCTASVMGVSQRYLPEALKGCRDTCSEVYVLGVGLERNPKSIVTELLALKEAGVRVWWISGLPIPQEIAAEFITKGGPVFEKTVVSEDGLFDAVRKAFPRCVSEEDVQTFGRYAAAKDRDDPKTDAEKYRRLFMAADWKHRNDREMDHYPKAISILAQGVKYANIGPELEKVVEYYRKWGKRQLIGNSEHIKSVIALAGIAAKNDDASVRVLITGPSGTGKETVAQLIHRKSSRADKSFLSFNCACTTATLVESKLFGSVKGSYTGADRDRKGLFEEAANGTLFLDEVAELNSEMQAQLLRVLQDGDYMRVGDSEPRHVENVRVIAATNKNLAKLVREGKFREDLYYRLNVIQIRMKPLSGHAEDIPQIANTIWFRETGSTLSPAQRSALTKYDFPGNARELENMLLYARVMQISNFTDLVNHWKRENMDLMRDATEGDADEDSLDAVIERHVRKVVDKYPGLSMKEIAAKLGRAENTVRGWLKRSLRN